AALDELALEVLGRKEIGFAAGRDQPGGGTELGQRRGDSLVRGDLTTDVVVAPATRLDDHVGCVRSQVEYDGVHQAPREVLDKRWLTQPRLDESSLLLTEAPGVPHGRAFYDRAY